MIRNTLLLLILLLSFSTIYSQAPVNEFCEDAITIQCGDLVSGSTFGANSEFESNSCFFLFDPRVWYRLTGDGSIHVFSYLSSSLGSFEFTIISNSCSVSGNMQCRGEHFFNSIDDTLRINTVPGEELFIAVTVGCCSDSGSFEFMYECEEAPVNDLCTNAIELNCQDVVDLSLSGASSEHFDRLCRDEREPDLWYSIQGDDMIHVIESNNIDSDFEIDVYEGGCNQRFNDCPIESLDFDFFNSTASFFAESGISYQLRIYKDFSSGDSIQFNHFCMQPAPNDLCENAEIVDCGNSLIGNTLFTTASDEFNGCLTERDNDLWYTINGDDMVHILTADSIQDFRLRIDIYEEFCSLNYSTCRQQISLSFGESNTFFAESGITYNIRVSDTEGYFEISNDCIIPLVNDNCENALEISCGQSIIGNTEFATSTMLFNGCTQERTNDLWYTITGDDLLYFLTLDSIPFSGINVDVYEQVCSTNYTICNRFFSFFREGEMRFFLAELGTTYNLRIYSDTNGASTFFDLGIECMEPLPNDTCENAEMINCGDTVEGDLSLATASLLSNACGFQGENDLWYQITGDSMIHLFNHTSNDIRTLGIEISTTSCDINSSDCVASTNLSRNEQFSFFAEPGISYFIRVFKSCCFGDDDLFSIEYTCTEPLENDACENPEIIDCNKNFEGDFTLATAEFENNPCDFNPNENDLWYQVNGDGLVHLLRFDSSDFTALRIEIITGSCDINSNECFETTEIQTNISYSFFAEQGISYLFRVYKSCCFGEGNFFRVEHSCLEPLANDSCDSPELWECGTEISGSTTIATSTNEFNGCIFEQESDLWYFIPGDDLVHSLGVINDNDNIDLFIYNEACGTNFSNCQIEFNTFGGGNGYNFLAESGQNYLVRLTASGCCDSNEDFQLSHECNPPASNDQCSSASPITCGEIVNSQSSVATPTLDNFCVSGDVNDVWFEFEGDSLIHFFNLVNPVNASIGIEVFESSCTASFNCPIFQFSNNNNNGFFAETGVSYLLRISSINNAEDFEVEHTCEEIASNNTCDEAEEIICGSLISGDTNIATSTDISSNCGFFNEQDLWYTIQGDGLIHEFTYLSGTIGDLEFLFLEEACDFQNPSCFRFDLFDFSNSSSVLLEDNTSYLIRIGGRFDNGNFMISHECRERAPNDTCDQAIQIECDNPIQGDTRNAINESISSVCDFDQSPDLWYSFQGDGSILNFEYLESNSNCLNIYLFEGNCPLDGEPCLERFRLSEGRNFRLLTELGTSYLFRINTCSEEAEFSLNFSCQEQAVNDFCENALPLICGTTIEGNTESALSSDEFNGCNNEFQDDLWYTITGDDQVHLFSNGSISNLEMDIYQGTCSTGFTACNNGIRINNDNFSFFAESGITYTIRIYVDLFGDDGQSFSINYECSEPPPNDSCENAIEITCEDPELIGDATFATFTNENNACERENQNDLWYFIQGDDMLHMLNFLDADSGVNINIFEDDDCANQLSNCVFDATLNVGGSISFYADPNENYLIRISTTGEFSLIHWCMDPVQNDQCQNAIPINCGESFEGNTEFATTRGVFNGCSSEFSNDLWYSFQGDDMIHNLILADTDASSVQIEISTNNCLLPLDTCIQSIRLSEDEEFRFLADSSEDYLLRISTDNFGPTNGTNFEIEHTCLTLASNNDCTNAEAITCGQTITGNTLEATTNLEFNGCRIERSPNLWYSIVGDDNIHSFNYNEVNNSNFIGINVYDGNCGSPFSDCFRDYTLTAFNPYASFLAEKGVEYLVLIETPCCVGDGPFSIDYQCNDPQINDDCENAIILECGDSLTGDLRNSSASGLIGDCTSEINNDLWFSIIGDDNFHIFDIGEFISSDLQIELYSSTCTNRFEPCSSLLLPENVDSTISFLAESGQAY